MTVERQMTSKTLRITFVTPHQQRASGGVYAIQQWAEQLARWSPVAVCVESGPIEPWKGVHVLRIDHARCEELPAADVLIFPADSRFGQTYSSLAATQGLPMVLFQGYGTPGSPIVVENLGRGHPVLASANWLVDEARRLGARSFLVPCGLDRAIFHPGREDDRDADLVSMLTHWLNWKGTADGIAALHSVLNARPQTRVVLFGRAQPEFPATFQHEPTRPQVAELMRRTAVFVCASWQEGLGLPGLEALACKASLATTDTMGSRDYAMPQDTALVSPPRESGTLANNILLLLNDAGLRCKLAAAGHEFVERRWPSWEASARSMFDVIRQECARAYRS